MASGPTLARPGDMDTFPSPDAPAKSVHRRFGARPRVGPDLTFQRASTRTQAHAADPVGDTHTEIERTR